MTTDTNLRQPVTELEEQLNAQFVDREEPIHGVLLGLLTQEHVLLLGPPGTSKTQMVSKVSQGLGLSYFRRLMTQFSTPDDVIGPVDIQGYTQEGKHRRLLAGKAADSQLVLLDEVFKAGPAILNCLLSLMEERIIDNDGEVVQAPLITLIGTSNELPSDDDGLMAFYDRFTLRYMTKYLDDELLIELLLTIQQSDLMQVMDLDTLVTIQQQVDAMPVPSSTVESVKLAWSQLRDHEQTVSDRRLRKLLNVMAAESWLTGYDEVVPSSLTAGTAVMWNKPEDYDEVKRILLASVNPHEARAGEIYEDLMELNSELVGMIDPSEKMQRLQQVKAMQAELEPMSDSRIVNRTKVKAAELFNSIVENI